MEKYTRKNIPKDWYLSDQGGFGMMGGIEKDEKGNTKVGEPEIIIDNETHNEDESKDTK